MTSGSTMRVETRFGRFQTPDHAVIGIRGGVPGFEGCTSYVLVSSPDIQPFNCLQGLESPQPSFLVIDPRLVDPAYSCDLTAADRRRLDLAEHDSLLWLAIVRVGAADGATVNLRAPIVVNPRKMLGLQALPHDSIYRHDHPLRLEAVGARLHS